MFVNLINLYTPKLEFSVRTHQFGCTDSIGWLQAYKNLLRIIVTRTSYHLPYDWSKDLAKN